MLNPKSCSTFRDPPLSRDRIPSVVMMICHVTPDMVRCCSPVSRERDRRLASVIRASFVVIDLTDGQWSFIVFLGGIVLRQR